MIKYFPDCPGRGWKPILILAALPLFFFLVALAYSYASAPWGAQVDPEATYAMNGIAWADDGYMRKGDHPGTTTILLAGLVVKGWVYLARSSDLVGFALKHFIDIIYVSRAIAAFILSLALFTGALIVRRAAHSVLAAVLFQVGPFVHSDLLHFETLLAPENLEVASALFGLALVLKAALDEKPPSVWLGAAQAVSFSIGLSSKYLHLPLALAGASLLRNRRALGTACLVAIVSFFIINHFLNPNVFTGGTRWLISLATHKGAYGSGERGFIDFAEFWPNLAKILIASPLSSLIFIGGGALAVVGAIRTKQLTDPIRLTLLSLSMIFAVQLVATAKHFSLHYMAGSWALTGGALVLTIVEMRRIAFQPSDRLLTVSVIPVCLALMVVPLVELQQRAVEWMHLDSIGARLSSAVETAAPSCANVSSMFVRAPENAISFGADTTLNAGIQHDYSEAYRRVYDAPLLDHSNYYLERLEKNFLPYSYQQLARDFPCIVVRANQRLEEKNDYGLLALHPDYCVVEGVNIYTVGIPCQTVQRAFASTQ